MIMKPDTTQLERLLQRASLGRIPAMPHRRAALKQALTRRVTARPAASPYVGYLRMVLPVCAAVFLFVLVGQGYIPITEAGKARVALRVADRAVASLSADERAYIESALGMDPQALIKEARRGRKLAVADSSAPQAAAGPMQLMATDSTFESASVSDAEPDDGDVRLFSQPVGDDAPQESVPPGDISDATGEDFAPPPALMRVAKAEILAPAVSFIRFSDREGNIITVGFDGNGIPVFREVR
jgi:hypothetical protein